MDTYSIYKSSLHTWVFDLKKIYNPNSGDNLYIISKTRYDTQY